MKISTNNDRYVIESKCGVSCLGFDVAQRRIEQYAGLLGTSIDDCPERGTLAHYEYYESLTNKLCAQKPAYTIFDPNTPVQVQNILESYRKSGAKLRIFCGDDVTGRDWLEENDVYGVVGRSMGPLKVALLVPPRANSGCAILTACIVKLVDGASKQVLWAHPRYHQPTFSVRALVPAGEYAAEVLADDEVHARFRTMARAQKYVEFLQGKRMTY